jgi:uncharacterized protein YifN (PemK superfamily)
MPKAFRVLEQLRAAGLHADEAFGIAKLVACAREINSVYAAGDVSQSLKSHGFAAIAAIQVASALSHCFDSARLGAAFRPNDLKFRMVRAGVRVPDAEAILAAIEPCVISAKGWEVRASLEFPPSAGKVVMCDFTFLQKPEMQKVRRAIVIARTASSNGRTTVVPVSKTRSIVISPYHHKFEPRAYPFFHQTDPVWAVCDHIYTVSLARVWKVNVENKPVFPNISAEDLAAIREKTATAIGRL